MDQLPLHLKKYIVSQNYEKYTALDHAVWRYILRQLKSFLSKHAHESYLDGLIKTGIDVDSIPKIEDISSHLEKFGWRALPVSGFIPPAAFMELQSLSILPIASDMRSIEHLLYTPAPDIVHEAAGHAPIIANQDYANYLTQYAQVAKKAIMSKEDLELYKAIRELSDIKENRTSTQQQIEEAEAKLLNLSKSISYVSEASELSRMNWWTAEYGLIGNIHSPKIFGAGLLSSVGESKWCLSSQVKKIPLTLNCIKQSYDITEPQPQLFVAESFSHLSSVLNELAQTMAYKLGGIIGLDKAIQAETVNTVEFENKVQISGVVKKYHTYDDSKQIAYVQFIGPTQICFEGQEVLGHHSRYHSAGYGTPIGKIKNLSVDDFTLNTEINLIYESGVNVKGRLVKINTLSKDAKILTLEKASAIYDGQTLFSPDWGNYDIIIANKITSVFGGPADRTAYGEIDDFVASRVPQPVYSTEQKKIFSFYQKIRDFRQKKVTQDQIVILFEEFKSQCSNEWLIFVELYELAVSAEVSTAILKSIENYLHQLTDLVPKYKEHITEGLNLAHAKF